MEIVLIVNGILFVYDAIQKCNAAASITKDAQTHTPNELCEVDVRDKHGTVLIWSCHGDQHTA